MFYDVHAQRQETYGAASITFQNLAYSLFYKINQKFLSIELNAYESKHVL